MPSDWTSNQRNSVTYGHRWPDGTVDRCTNDAYSIVRASLDGLSQMGIVSPGSPVLSSGYFGSLASALETSRLASRNSVFADACRDASVFPPGTPIQVNVLRSIVWSAYYFVGNGGETGVGSPENVVLPDDTVPPRAGAALPLPTNGQFNDSACIPGGASTPGGVAGWAQNPLLIIGLIGAGTLVVNAINAKAPRASWRR